MTRVVVMSGLTLVFVLFTMLGLFALANQVHLAQAQQAEISKVPEMELLRRINEANVNIDSLDEEIRELEGEIFEISSHRSSLEQASSQIGTTQKKLERELAEKNEELKKSEFTLELLSRSISEQSTYLENGKEAVGEAIRRLHQIDDITTLEVMFSSETIADFWKTADQLDTFQVILRENGKQLEQLRRDLESSKKKTAGELQVLQKLRGEVVDRKKVVDVNKAEQDALIKETRNEESEYQRLLTERRLRREAFEASLFEFESKLQYLLDPTKLPTGRVLSYPIASDKVYVTQFFGLTPSSRQLYRSGRHNGMDFGIPTGTPVLAMADGVVAGVGDTDKTCRGTSFGGWMLIKYDNGLASTYGHLSYSPLREGTRVARGQVVAYSGNTGHSTGPHLHVSIYPADAVKPTERPSTTCPGRIYRMPIAPVTSYLDPAQYMPEVPREKIKGSARY